MALYLRRVDNIVTGVGNTLIVAVRRIVALIHRRDIDSKSNLYQELIVPIDQVIKQRLDDARNSNCSDNFAYFRKTWAHGAVLTRLSN